MEGPVQGGPRDPVQHNTWGEKLDTFKNVMGAKGMTGVPTKGLVLGSGGKGNLLLGWDLEPQKNACASKAAQNPSLRSMAAAFWDEKVRPVRLRALCLS